MAKQTNLTNLVVNTQGDAMATLFNAGFLDLMDGAQPATGNTAITTQNVLASVGFNATAFGATAAGVLTANAMTACSSANLTGVSTWARCYKADHATALMDVSVGTANTNVVLNSANIQANAQVSVSAFTHTIAKSTSGS